MSRDILDALKKKYEAEVDIAKATIQIYIDKPVGIGEHPQFLDELDKVLTKISNAEENLKTLSKHFDNSVDDDDIPF